MNIKKVGVVGAGIMGMGVAQNLASKGFEVVLVDVSENILNLSKKQILDNMRLYGFIHPKEKIDNSVEIIERISFTTNFHDLEIVDYLIENVVERWEEKEKVYKNIDTICPSNCIFAVNTSAISITRIASLTKRPSSVIGIHFMNPVPLKKIVEVIMGYHTSTQTLEVTKTLLHSMGKESVVINDWPGFVSNRVLMLMVNEAIYLLQDGIAKACDVDRIFKGCFEHKMGPLETADMIGLDTILYSIEVLYESFNDDKYRPCPMLKKMVSAGLLGRKSGHGFYNY